MVSLYFGAPAIFVFVIVLILRAVNFLIYRLKNTYSFFSIKKIVARTPDAKSGRWIVQKRWCFGFSKCIFFFFCSIAMLGGQAIVIVGAVVLIILNQAYQCGKFWFLAQFFECFFSCLYGKFTSWRLSTSVLFWRRGCVYVFYGVR